ncbi:hypothetical protein EAH78_01815 [Pseudomonas arsenicoxydans]|uniref:Uncharacterized protein n=1 Tax=Pseudomonas arsenicoxydans TaxID=702115 RepID=A0A502I3S8_9PSED|nr:hypothetical protein EAH78_01815 [Pseudomonas arsenicoxydans]
MRSGNELWRGSLLPLGREAPLKSGAAVYLQERSGRFATAAQPSGSKLPRHRFGFTIKLFAPCRTHPGASVESPGQMHRPPSTTATHAH